MSRQGSDQSNQGFPKAADILGGVIERRSDQPAHALVREHIRSLIESGELTNGTQLPPEPELAQMLGVSRMTANRALTDLRRDGFLVREKGRGTFVHLPGNQGTQGDIAVLLNVDVEPAYDDCYFGPMFWSLHSLAHERDYRLHILRQTPDSETNPLVRDARGIIAITPEESMVEDLVRMRRSGKPVVILGASWPNFSLTSIDSDNQLGAALAVNHLADLGHRRIMFVGGYPEASNTKDRVQGFTFAVKSRGLTFDKGTDLLVADHPHLSAEDLTHLRQLLTEENAPTAVFAAGPFLAFQIANELTSLGLRLPDDLSLVAYDDPKFLSFVHPAVTTVRQPLAKMAKEALNQLGKLIETRDPRDVHRILDPTLVVRGSTGAPSLQ